MTQNQDLINLIDSTGNGPVLVHSDVFRVMGVIKGVLDPNLLLDMHLSFLDRISSSRGLIFPTFNYDFTRRKLFDVKKSDSQVGALSEYVRCKWSTWRSLTPVFNFCGNDDFKQFSPLLEIDDGDDSVIDPFDESSLFHALYKNDGVVVMYGAPFKRFTGIHYIEHCSGRPLYRYDKLFNGQVKDWNECVHAVTLNYHVRPEWMNLTYDWKSLYDLSLREGAVQEIKRPKVSVSVINFKLICDIWLSLLKQDPLVLLDERSRALVEPLINKLGRRFVINDFE